jgi:hypothetical protein
MSHMSDVLLSFVEVSKAHLSSQYHPYGHINLGFVNVQQTLSGLALEDGCLFPFQLSSVGSGKFSEGRRTLSLSRAWEE